MTSGNSGERILVLSAQDAAYVREALAAASAVFARAEAAGGAALEALQDAALDAPGGLPLAGVRYQVCLAVDYTGFPMPVPDAR